jgi:hypothetical protein
MIEELWEVVFSVDRAEAISVASRVEFERGTQ